MQTCCWICCEPLLHDGGSLEVLGHLFLSGCVRKAGTDRETHRFENVTAWWLTAFVGLFVFLSGNKGMIDTAGATSLTIATAGATSLTVSSYITALASTVVAFVLVKVG